MSPCCDPIGQGVYDYFEARSWASVCPCVSAHVQAAHDFKYLENHIFDSEREMETLRGIDAIRKRAVWDGAYQRDDVMYYLNSEGRCCSWKPK